MSSETGVQTNANIGFQGMQLGYGADGNSYVYKPVAISGAVNAPAVYLQPAGGGADIGRETAINNTKKRGRPRKYGVHIGAEVTSPPLNTSAPPPATVGGELSSGEGAFQFSSSQAPATVHYAPPSSPLKKARGRPLGSGIKIEHQPNNNIKIEHQPSNNIGSTGFTPHFITVNAGEDVASRIMSFSQNGPRAVCILSATGAVSNVTLRQPSMSGGTVTYEGFFEILSLSGSFMVSESSGRRSRIGGLSVTLAGPDGCVLGGSVAGLLTAANPVQVVVGTFMAEGGQESRPLNQTDPFVGSQQFISGMVGLTRHSSPSSRGTPSETSGGAGSPVNQNMGACINNTQPGMHPMSWN